MTPPRRIVLCADDYGMAPGVNAAIRDLIARGLINATSVMVATPSFDRAAAEALSQLKRAAPSFQIGLHFTLTAPFHPLTRGYSVLQNGVFLSIADTFKAGFFGRLDRVTVAREAAAQIDAFVAGFGCKPDYVDGHQHVHLFPVVRDGLLDAVTSKTPQSWVRQCGRVTPLRRRISDPKGVVLDILSQGFRARAKARGVATNPGFAGTYDFSQASDFSALFPEFLESLPEGSVVMCHPGFVDDELTRLDPVTTARQREYDYFTASAFPRDLQAHNMTLR